MKAKGTAIQTIPQFVKDKFGEDSLQRWIAALPEPARGEFSKPILASSWYSLKDMLVDPTLKACELFYKGSMLGAEELGKFSADHALKGIYKLFVKFGSVEFIVSKAGTIFSTYYENSQMSVVEKTERKILLRISRFDEPHEVVEARIKGWMIRALEISGAKSLMVTIDSSMTKGAPHTDYRITWS